MKRANFSLLLVICLVFLQSCGRYGKPIPPEAVAPRQVQNLQITTNDQGVKFNWDPPSHDVRGKKLKEIDGYFVYRRDSEIGEDIIKKHKSSNFDLLTTIADTHLKVLKERKEEALSKDEPARRLKADDSLTKFEYLDSKVSPGQLYFYKIVAFNQGDEEGQVRKLIKILFKGEQSEVTLVDNSEEDDFNNNDFWDS